MKQLHIFCVIASSLGGCAEPVGPVYRGETMGVTDIHLHNGNWALIRGSTQRFLAGNFPFPLDLKPDETAEAVLSAEGILSELDGAGIERAGLLAVYAPRTVGVATNSLVQKATAVEPTRLFGFASLSVDNWSKEGDAALGKLSEALEDAQMLGVKLAHTHQHFRMDDPRYWPIYEIAATHSAPVYLHTGSSPFPGTQPSPPYTDPAYLEEAIAEYPNTTFILGHLGHDFVNKERGQLSTCLDLAQRYPNVYLEPSALGSAGSDPDGVFLKEAMAEIHAAGLVERVIYGSDGPQSPGFVDRYLQSTLSAMNAADYSVEEARMVLDGNFARAFGLSPLVQR